VGKVRRLVLPVLLGLAAYYALFGGEYSLFELRKARKEVLVQERELVALRREVDSLRAWVDSLQNDSATLERLARERIGMVREGEVLYRLAEPRVVRPDTLP
jgi:cell division protein FtsB